MSGRNPGRDMAAHDPDKARRDRERRIEFLLRRLPLRLQPTWKAAPSVGALAASLCRRVADPGRPVQHPAGTGLWMLPLGLLLLAEDVKPVRRVTDRMLIWIERRRPHWVGLPHAASRQPGASESETP